MNQSPLEILRQSIEYLRDNAGAVGRMFAQHLLLTSATLLIALVIAVPLGLLATRVRWLRAPLLSLLGVIYTIPSLSLFVLLIPLLGLGIRPALVALVAYAQLILVRNIVVGLEGIDPAISEAARGMGLNNWQRFWRVELPLALPLILAGLRVAAISTIGIGTIAAFINAGGLGTLLFQGVSTFNFRLIVAGAIAVSALAIGVNALLWLAERQATIAVRGD